MSDEQFRSAFENAAIGMNITGLDGRWLRVNQALCELLGYTKEELFNRSLADLTHPADVAQDLEAIRRFLAGEIKIHQREKRYIHKDGHHVHVFLSVSMVRDPQGNPLHFIAQIQDISQRTRIEEALQENVSLLTSTLESTADGILVVDSARKIVAFNETFLQLWRIPLHVIEPRDDEQLLEYVVSQLKDPEGFMRRVRELYAKPAASSFDIIEFRDGRLYERYCQPQILDGRPVGRVWSFRDQTERRRMEESLRASEAELRAIFAAMSDVILVLDNEGRYLKIAPTDPSLLYKPPAELVGKTVHDTFPAKQADFFLDAITCALHERTPFNIEYNLTIEDREMWFAGTVSPMTEHSVIIVARDMTERKRAEAARLEAESALRRNEQLFRTLIENAEDLITVFNRDWTIRYESPAVERILGFKPGELHGRKLLEIVHPEDRRAMLKSMRYKMEHPGELVPVHGRILHKDGTHRVLEGSSVNLLDNPAVAGIVANTRDVTEREESKARLRESEDQLRQSQKMEAVGKLAGGIAHDFNNLLTAINGYSEILLRRLDASDPSRRAIGEIKKAGERAAQLTKQLLAFSRKQMLQPKIFDLNQAIAEVDDLLRRLIGEHIDLVVRLDSSAGLIEADPAQLEQVVINLAVNARDAMPDGGELIIETQNIDLDEHTAGRVAMRPGAYVLLAIHDNGTGMSEEVRARAFEPFFTTKPQGKGTGLGLSTVYGIVKQSGGNVWLRSEAGRGTTFKIYLPRVEEEECTLSTNASPAMKTNSAPCRAETVLLVEDEEVVRRLTQEMLEELGYRVLSACHGEEALQIASQHATSISLLLTDVVMPRMSGRELAERITSVHPHVKVVYMSGYTDESVVLHGIVNSDVAFLHKPFTPDNLSRTVREVLDASSNNT